jgi:hypothetical protein
LNQNIKKIDVKIRLNDENSDIYIVKGETYSTEDFPTHQIVCTSPVGSKFRFEAWAVNRSNVY